MLSLLSVPMNAHVLRALEEESRSLIDLRRTLGSPPQTTMRGHLRNLTELGVLDRRRDGAFPGRVDYALTPAGNHLCRVADSLDAWLALSPGGALEPGSVGAKSAIRAAVEAWSCGMIRILAAKPSSLTELNKLISGLNYPSLERRLVAMRLCGQIEAWPGNGRGTPYVVTDWLRQSVPPIASAARWERRYLPEQTAPIGRIDVEAAFLLALPLLRLSPEVSGWCRLGVETRRSAGELAIAGVLVQVDEGRIIAGSSRLDGEADAWVLGSAMGWIAAIGEGDPDRLEVGGDCDIALAVLDGLHYALLASESPRPTAPVPHS